MQIEVCSLSGPGALNPYLEEGEEDDPADTLNDMGIPIEPFNMRREREEGYFDKGGCGCNPIKG
jgi:hypothetical protein